MFNIFPPNQKVKNLKKYKEWISEKLTEKTAIFFNILQDYPVFFMIENKNRTSTMIIMKKSYNFCSLVKVLFNNHFFLLSL